MRFTQTVLPVLAAGLSLVDAQNLDFSKVYSVKPALASTKVAVTSSKSTNTTSMATSIVSSLSSQHAAASRAEASASSASMASEKSASGTKKTSSTLVKSTKAASTSSAKKSSSTSTKKASSTSTKKASSTSVKKASTSAAAVKKVSTSSVKKVSTSSAKKASSTKKATTSSAKKVAREAKESAKSAPSVEVKAKAATVASSSSQTSSSTTSAATSGCTDPSIIFYNYTPSQNPTNFLLDTTFSNAAASNYVPPAGYSTSFINQFAASKQNPYVGYRQLSSYNTSACADYCNNAEGCVAFNIYYERTPLYVANNQCRNPTAEAAVSCGLYGSWLNVSTATNTGQYKIDFMVLEAGSNGYNLNPAPAAVANFTGPTALYGAVNVNTIGSQTVYIGYNFFSTYNVQTCANACYAYTQQQRASAISSKSSSYTACNYFNPFNLTLNGQFQGMYCQFYTTSNASNYATLTSATSNGNTYNLTYSYGYALYPADQGSTAVTWAPAPTGTAAACSNLGAVGSNLTDYNQVTYTLGCGYDIQYANDVGNAPSPDFYSCFNLCDNFSGCSGFSYLPSSNTSGTCYFKNLTGASRTPSLSSGNVDMAWMASSYAGFSASTIAASVTFTTITTAWTGASTFTTTMLSGLTASVLVETPGAVAKNTGYTTIATDSGTAATPITTTIGSTVKITYPTPVTTCGNGGAKYAIYSNKWAGSQGPSGYPAFTPQAYKTVKPSITGTATYMGVSVASATPVVNVYGNKINALTLAIDQTFYIFAGRGTGYYALNIPYADDVTFVWVGATALSGWTRANALLMSYWYQYGATPSPQTYAFYLTEGTYTPVRVQWANGGGDGDFQFNVYAPDGSTLISSTPGQNAGYMSPDIVTSPCNASLGAAFPAWGAET